MTAQFIEGNHPGAYTASGEFQGNAEPAQHALVPAETEGYKAPGGELRGSIRDRIAAARPYKSELKEVPDWDSTIEVRSIPLGVRNEMMAGIIDEETGKGDFQAMFPALLIAACFDPETGEKVFAADDAAFINGLDSSVVDPIAKVAMRLAGMEDEAKDKTAGKSSETGTSV